MKRAGFGNVSKIVGINNLDKTVCGGVLCLYCGKWCLWGVCVSFIVCFFVFVKKICVFVCKCKVGVFYAFERGVRGLLVFLFVSVCL